MNNPTPSQIFNAQGALHVKDVLPKELQMFLTSVLMLKASDNNVRALPGGDAQIPNAKAIISHDIATNCVLEYVWPAVEAVLEEELIPTYAYARLYSNGDELTKHTDRPACEVSVTIQLARTHHYSWPIYMGGKRFDLAEGDGVIYKGCDIEHWREPCNGPEDYLSGQIFLHFVRKNGIYEEWAGDKEWPNDLPFMRGRQLLLENK